MPTANPLAPVGRWLFLLIALLPHARAWAAPPQPAVSAGPATAAAVTPASPRVVNYTIEATYDGEAQSIAGREVIHWTNTSQQPAQELQLHLYLNAFANNRSSFMHELGNAWEDWNERYPQGWGAIHVSALRVGSHVLNGRLQFIHPDDENSEDRTVAQVPLPLAVQAGESVDIEIAFTARLPRVLARAGYAGPFAMVAQWFPKLGVFEAGRWVCHQYHATTEFYADFGAYDVTLTVPGDGVVGATGTLRDEQRNPDGTRTLHFAATDVHDFAWAIDARFRSFERRVDNVAVRLLLQPNHADQAQRHFAAITAALRWYRNHIGAYPYPQLTIVDPGPGAGGAGGMEYPTLITAGTRWWMPARWRLPEIVTVHEFGHQYWYGMVASNEAEEAWLDEGINTYIEGLIMDETYAHGSYADLFGVQLDSTTAERLQYLRSSQHDPLMRRAWEFLDARSYGSVSYAKTALVLRTLDGLWGNGVVERALRTYFERWRFRHPRGKDFLAVLAEVSGKDLSAIEAQLFQGSGTVDYAVTRLSAEPEKSFRGYQIGTENLGSIVPGNDNPELRYRNEVIVERLGEVKLPVPVQIFFDDGSTVNETWNGEDRWKRFEYAGPQRVEWAVVDPEHTRVLDVNWLNNSRMRGAGTRGLYRISGRWMFWFQNILHMLGGF